MERAQELLYFFPEGLKLEHKLAHVGQCKAALHIMRDFAPLQAGVPARTATIELTERRISMREVEPGVWAAVVIKGALFESRPPTDGGEMRGEGHMPASTEHAPQVPDATPPGEGGRAAAERAGAAAGGGGIGGDWRQLVSESDAQSLIDAVYRRTRCLVGAVWPSLGGPGGRRLLAATRGLLARRRKLINKSGRAEERERHSTAKAPQRPDGAAKPREEMSEEELAAEQRDVAALPATSSSLRERVGAAEAALSRAMAAWPLRGLRRRLRRAVTWCLWCVDCVCWGPVDARDGPTPSPLDPGAAGLVMGVSAELRACHSSVDSVCMLWGGGVTIQGPADRWAAPLAVLRGIAWQVTHGAPVLPAEGVAAGPASAGDGWEAAVLRAEFGCDAATTLPDLGVPGKFFSARRPASSRPLPLVASAGERGCEAGMVGLVSNAVLPVTGTLRPGWAAGMGAAAAEAEAALSRIEGTGPSGAAAGAAGVGPDEGGDAYGPGPGPLGPAVAVLGLAGGHWSESMRRSRGTGGAAAVARDSPRLLALPLCLSRGGSPVASHRLLWIQHGGLTVAVLARESGCEWSAPSASAASPSLLELAQRLAGTLAHRVGPLVEAMAAGAEASRRRGLRDCMVQRHADQGSVAVFGALRPEGDVSCRDAFGAIPRLSHALMSRAAGAAGWRLPPPVAGRDSPWTSGLAERPGAAADDADGASAISQAGGGLPSTRLVRDAADAAADELCRCDELEAAAEAEEGGAGEGAAALLLRRREWAAGRWHWAAVSAGHWDMSGGGGGGGGTADVPANYSTPGDMARAALRVAATPSNAVSVARPSLTSARATAPAVPTRCERIEFTRHYGGAVARREGYREVVTVHTETASIAKAAHRARELLAPRFRNVHL